MKISRHMPPLERLAAQSVAVASGCREWVGKKNQHGYGKFKIDGKEHRCHREMYFLSNPTANRSLQVLHRCDNPACINLDHLFLGTQRDNMLDMHAKGRFGGGAKPGNKNALGNQGWKVATMRAFVASKK